MLRFLAFAFRPIDYAYGTTEDGDRTLILSEPGGDIVLTMYFEDAQTLRVISDHDYGERFEAYMLIQRAQGWVPAFGCA